jgi:hypothetical protein
MAYVSNVLTHWVGRGKTPEEQYFILTNRILKEKELLYGSCPWHFSSKYGGVIKYNIRMISFADIPFSECANHCNKYSHFGLSFDKHYLANCLASPVGYVQHPLIHQNYSDIYHTLQGMKKVLNGVEIPEGNKKGTKFNVEYLLSRFQYMMCFVEDYSKREFIYNEGAGEPLPGQEYFFEDASALYYEREWRMLLSSTAKNLPWHVTHDGNIYFQFDERYLKWVIIPRAYLTQLQEECVNIFSNYRPGDMPSFIAYEDLEYF